MQLIIRQSDLGSTHDLIVIAIYDDSVSVDPAIHGQGLMAVKDVPPSMVSMKMSAGQPPIPLLNAQWLAANRPQGLKAG